MLTYFSKIKLLKMKLFKTFIFIIFQNPKSYNYFFEITFLNGSEAVFLNSNFDYKHFNSSISNSFCFETNLFDFYKKTYNSKSDTEYFYSNTRKDEEFFYSSYFFFKNSSYISFFLNNMIDVPVCFKKSKSLRRISFELPILKLFNLIMWKGKKEKCLKTIFKNYFSFFNNMNSFKNNSILLENYLNLLNFFFLPNSNLFSKKDNSFFFEDQLLSESLFKNNFLINLSALSPVFSYYVYSVDKNVRKYSRGKSGKYVFIWKYVAPYKRQYQALRWITKELKFRFEKTLNQRFSSIFYNLKFDLKNTFVWKSKVFSHNYVFKNFKKSLMVNLKTIVK